MVSKIEPDVSNIHGKPAAKVMGKQLRAKNKR